MENTKYPNDIDDKILISLSAYKLIEIIRSLLDIKYVKPPFDKGSDDLNDIKFEFKSFINEIIYLLHRKKLNFYEFEYELEYEFEFLYKNLIKCICKSLKNKLKIEIKDAYIDFGLKYEIVNKCQSCMEEVSNRVALSMCISHHSTKLEDIGTIVTKDTGEVSLEESSHFFLKYRK